MTETLKIAAPRNVEQATALCERYAVLAGEIGTIDSTRNKAIADANSIADKAADKLIAERDAIAAKLEPWWKRAAEKLTEGKRKTIELGGCIIGSRAGRKSLAIEGDEEAAVKVLSKYAWAKPLLKVSSKLDKPAILKSIDGIYKKQLALAGLSCSNGCETFILERAEQEGTRK